MNNRHPNRADAETAAIEWIARLRANDVTDAERAEFATWLAQSSVNKAAFDEMADLWQLTGNLHTDPTTLSAAHSPRAWAPLSLAAGVLIGLLMLFSTGGTSHFETQPGEQRRVVLEDGTTIHLNTRTELAVRYDGKQRTVTLGAEGEAFFDVASDPARPFVVRTPHGEIRVLGTEFSVQARPASTRVTVLEGRVNVSNADGDNANLNAAQHASIASSHVTLGDEPTGREVAPWRNGRLIYDSVTLEHLVADLSRYLPQPMSVADEALAKQRVSAVLQLQEQEAMIDALAESLELSWTNLSDNLILLHRR